MKSNIRAMSVKRVKEKKKKKITNTKVFQYLSKKLIEMYRKKLIRIIINFMFIHEVFLKNKK